MGAACGKSRAKIRNEEVDDEPNYDREAPGLSGEGKVRMLIIANDYKGIEGCELTCTEDGKAIEELAEACGVDELHTLYDRQATYEAVKAKICEVCRNCEPDDYFVFYYSGHGTRLEDDDGDEEDGYDEALCLLDSAGRNIETMRDDEFVTLVTSNIDPAARVLVLADCCHSASVADFSHKDEWGDIQAISICGAADVQTAGDTGYGGVFTHSLLIAIERLQEKEGVAEGYSVGRCFNKCLQEDNRIFNSEQDISIAFSEAAQPSTMAWPLVPLDTYTPPKSRRNLMAKSAPGVVADAIKASIQGGD